MEAVLIEHRRAQSMQAGLSGFFMRLMTVFRSASQRRANDIVMDWRIEASGTRRASFEVRGRVTAPSKVLSGWGKAVSRTPRTLAPRIGKLDFSMLFRRNGTATLRDRKDARSLVVNCDPAGTSSLVGDSLSDDQSKNDRLDDSHAFDCCFLPYTTNFSRHDSALITTLLLRSHS